MEFFTKSKKIKTKEEIAEVVLELRGQNPGINIVTTNGAFDLLHINHIYSLRKARSFGDKLIVGLNSDISIRQYKSLDRPIINQNERAEMLASLDCVDYVVMFDETDPREFLKVVKPDFHVKSKEGYKGIEHDVIVQNGGKIVLIEHRLGETDTCTSKIMDIIKNLKE